MNGTAIGVKLISFENAKTFVRGFFKAYLRISMNKAKESESKHHHKNPFYNPPDFLGDMGEHEPLVFTAVFDDFLGT